MFHVYETIFRYHRVISRCNVPKQTRAIFIFAPRLVLIGIQRPMNAGDSNEWIGIFQAFHVNQRD